MRDVAQKAHVSITTVSHVLNDTRPVAKATRARVLRAVADLNYFANSSARLLVRGQSNLLGLVVSDIENPFFPEVIKNFEEACGRERMEMLLCTTNYQRAQADAALRRMLENRVQGVAVMTSQFDEGLVAQLTEKDVPLVQLGSGRPKRNRSIIALDYRGGVSAAVQHLFKLGHRSVAIASGPQQQVSAAEYHQALLDALRVSGLNPSMVIEGDHTPESGAEAVQTLLRESPVPTALFCGNDRMAIGALGAAVRLGLRVPQDISIVGSDDIWMARYCYPALTTVRIPRDRLGQLAFEMLNKMIQSKRKSGVRQVLETELVQRRSTGLLGNKDMQVEDTMVKRVHVG